MNHPIPKTSEVIEFAGMGYYERKLETRLIEGRLQYKDYPSGKWKWADENKTYCHVRLEDGTTRPFTMDDARSWQKNQ